LNAEKVYKGAGKVVGAVKEGVINRLKGSDEIKEMTGIVEKPDLSKVHGRIQYVDRFPDYRVEVVDALEDLEVQEVSCLANGPGLWQIVDTFPDYKIQIVDSFSDFKIRFVSSLPGPK
jgi:hypothetical protein